MRLSTLAISFAVLSVTGSLHAGEPLWLTLMGDATRADTDTVQVMVESVTLDGVTGSLQLRVNRSQTREAVDKLPYRSFIGWIKVNCPRSEGRYQQVQFYTEPLWTGELRVGNYSEPDQPQVIFRDMQPNPTDRLIRAACSIEKIKSQ